MGIFYGEKDYYSLRSVTRKIFWINIIVAAVITAVIAALPNVYSFIFGYTEQTDMSYIAFLIRIYLISLLPSEISKFSMNYYPK